MKTSGAPLPIASSVIPAMLGERRSLLERRFRGGIKKLSACRNDKNYFVKNTILDNIIDCVCRTFGETERRKMKKRRDWGGERWGEGVR